MKYRDTLYHNYSTHFGAKPDLPDELHFAMFDKVYPPRPRVAGAVLDLACGRGAWLRWMAARGAKDVAGVDWSQFDLDAVNLPGATLTRGDIFEFLRKGTDLFSVIHGKDIIEHMTKDEVVEFLSLCRDRLVPAGSLWISTFNALAPMAAQTWRGDFTHEMAFTPGSMKQVMHACGFPEVEILCCHPVPPTLNGWMRLWLNKPVALICEFVTRLRYGSSGDLNCLPSLLAFGKTPDRPGDSEKASVPKSS